MKKIRKGRTLEVGPPPGFKPDWEMLCSHKKFFDSFVWVTRSRPKFKGPGWYFDGTITLLVLPGGKGTMKTGNVGKPVYWFYYYEQDPRKGWFDLLCLPTQMDRE